jgi:hypothetical protein
MTWLLIVLWVSGGHPMQLTQQFSTHDFCVAALDSITNDMVTSQNQALRPEYRDPRWVSAGCYLQQRPGDAK